ncbi:hypothetical protein N7495_007782 [Penicillium taxi]|uniref:uncharacterized protein n=1 Tax=Penicillium taxi TaxID=168475 RepID=UPI0025450141|nr:uncharacterized protein N7495_007782 [Penicillium taxi]KAJ5887741.1 hypothetical protein N7495_007782 [Penicillium taxi]
MKPANKHFRCTVCQRGFTRIDHLKRHQLRPLDKHSPNTYSDNLRDHYSDCVERGNRQIPETGQRGRRRHACQSCTSMKLRCDGNSPCEACVKRNIQCNNERTARQHTSVFYEGSSPNKQEMYPQASDRGSIKFLLNGGTETFTEGFQLPPRSDRPRDMACLNNEMEDVVGAGFPFDAGVTPDYTPAFIDSDPVSFQFFEDTFLDFFNGPFGDGQKSLEDPFAGQIYQTAIATPDSSIGLSADQAIFEPERPFAMALIQAILARAWTVPLDVKSQEEISSNLNYLLTTARIRKFTSLYFKYWQPSCSMIHFASFDPELASLSLLASVVFMGAMYSPDQREVHIAKRLLDFAELFIFSNHIYSPESEIATIFTGGSTPDDNTNDWVTFQNFQAGLLISVVQYWAGSRASQNRAMENRFSEVIKVMRRLGLVKCRHQLDEKSSEELWIQIECRIRTVATISLLDCAFFFYQNYPCRLTYTEMENDLPSEDALFQSPHPFSEPFFRYSRNLTIYDSFQNLFDSSDGSEIKTMDLTILDMFILIHSMASSSTSSVGY